MGTDLRNSVAEAEELPWWFLRLPASLERDFNVESAPQRNRQLRFWIAVNLAFYWFCLGLDHIAVPDRIWLSFAVRLFFMTPVTACAVLLLRTLKPGPWESAAVIVAPTLTTLAQLGIFASSAHFDPFLAAVVLGLEVLWMNVLFPMRVRDAAIFSCITMVSGDLLNAAAASLHGETGRYPNVAIAAHALVALSVLGRAVAEQNLRRSFLQGLKVHMHVEDLCRVNDKLLELSNTDPLTGVANRRSFDRALEQAWKNAVEAGDPLALMMIDVDNFKLFNDTAGHLEGDRCLATLASIIAQQVRPGRDVVARFGGEEFVVLMPGAEADQAGQAGMRIRTALAAQRVVHPAAVGNGLVTVSIGIAAATSAIRSRTPADLIAAADGAMYQVKRNGRDGVRLARRTSVPEPVMM